MPISVLCPGCGLEPHAWANPFCDTRSDLPSWKPFDLHFWSIRELREDAEDPHGKLAESELTTARIAAQVVAYELALLEQATERVAHKALTPSACELDPKLKDAAGRMHAQVQALAAEWSTTTDALTNDQFMPAGVQYIDHVARVAVSCEVQDAVDDSRSEPGVEKEAGRHYSWAWHTEARACPSCTTAKAS